DKSQDSKQSEIEHNNTQNQVSTCKPYRTDGFRDKEDIDIVANIWVDVDGNEISFAGDYPKTLNCDYVGSPVVQLSPTDNEIFYKSVFSDGSVDKRIREVTYMEKQFGEVSMKLATTRYTENNDRYIAISHVWGDTDKSDCGQFAGRNVSSKAKALALSQILQY